jgi:hypothetical protein
MRKIRLYKNILFEILETLCTICLYLETEGRRNRNPYGVHFHSHFDRLKELSMELKGKQE